MSLIIHKALIPLGITMLSAGTTAGGIFLWSSGDIQQAKLEKENPNILTIYKKEDSGYLVLGENKNNRWNPPPKNKSSISLGEKGWQYERQNNIEKTNKDYFQLKGEKGEESITKEELTNNYGIDGGDLSGVVKIYLSGAICKDLDLNENFKSVSWEASKMSSVEERRSREGFAFWTCKDK